LVEGLVEGLVETQQKMIYLIFENPSITIKELSVSLGISTTAVDKNLVKLKEKNMLKRIGGDKIGSWEIILK
jgi:ATP-dependent DNA helicase RecG